MPAAETAGALAELVADGKIGHAGVFNYDTAQMEEFSEALPVERVSRRTTCSGEIMRRGCCPTVVPATSRCWCTGRWHTAC
ncbi:hypothetical protein OYT95_37180 [Rhodococcus sp. JS3073]|nr:hypothetical protein OYT95_37180 [Rhodococcus sp. JS3073]